MTADIRKIVTVVEETLIEGGRAVITADEAGGCCRGDRRTPSPETMSRTWLRLLTWVKNSASCSPNAPSRRLVFPAQRSRASARQPRSAPRANSSTPPPSSIRSWARRSAACSARVRAHSLFEEACRARRPLDIPLGHKDAAYVRSHFDGMEVRIADAPRADEIVVAIAVTDSGRPHARVGGLRKEEIKGEDGLR